MNTDIFNVDVSILLKPIGAPKCRISINDQQQELIITREQWIKISYHGLGNTRLLIEHYGKDDKDPTTAIIIEKIKFNELCEPKFVWEGTFYPRYPKHLSGESALKYHNYLGWNGVWVLDFTLPIYTWIHKTLDLGWIYD